MGRYKVIGLEVYHEGVHLPAGFELELSEAAAELHGPGLQKVPPPAPPRKGLKKDE